MKQIIIVILGGLLLGYMIRADYKHPCPNLRNTPTEWMRVSSAGGYAAAIEGELTIFNQDTCYSVDGWIDDAYSDFLGWSPDGTYFAWSRSAMGSSGCISTSVIRSAAGAVITTFGGCIGINPRIAFVRWLDDNRLLVEDLFCFNSEVGCYLIYDIRDETVISHLAKRM